MLHLVALAGFALRRHLADVGHLACFHTANLSNYVLPSIFGWCKQDLSRVSKTFKIRIYRKMFLHLWFFWTSELFQTSQTTWIPGHGTKYIMQASSVSHKTFLMLRLFWDGLVAALSLLWQTGSFLHLLLCPTKTLKAALVCFCGLFYLSRTYSAEL